MSGDLALIAGRRGGLAALLGLLLLEEPGPGLAELVAEVPALSPLASGGAELATEYERVFLRGVPLYESVFRSDDGQHGGEALAAVVERYDRLGYREHVERRWRIAGADHLGVELRCHAQLCLDESDAWHSDTPDRAVSAVEAERALLADHLATWAPVALGAAAQVAAAGPYRAVLDATSTFLEEECERLRPAPAFGAGPEPGSLPTHLGAARLARLLLAPASSGTWLATDTIATAARSIGAPWRPSDNRSELRHVIESAADTGDLPLVLEPLVEALRQAAAAHRDSAERAAGNAANAQCWAARADAMAERLEQVARVGFTTRLAARTAEVLTIGGTDTAQLADAVDAVVSELRSRGFTVERQGSTAPDR